MAGFQTCLQWTGIRQGCPFSPLAFVLAVELLAINIRDCTDIKGLRHWDALNDAALEATISLYADGITLFLENEQDMFYALSIIEDFSLISGLKINKNKSEAMWLGSKKHCRQSFFNFVWKKKIKFIGLFFCNDKCASSVEENWTDKINIIKRLIATWEKRNLRNMGNICIIKTFLLSQIVYIMQVLSFLIMHWQKLIGYCLDLMEKKDCNRKAFEKVKRVVMCKDFEKRGLKMIEVKQMQASFSDALGSSAMHASTSHGQMELDTKGYFFTFLAQF